MKEDCCFHLSIVLISCVNVPFQFIEKPNLELVPDKQVQMSRFVQIVPKIMNKREELAKQCMADA